jgi:hypothetical protein
MNNIIELQTNIDRLSSLIQSHFDKLHKVKELITKQHINIIYDKNMDLAKYLTDIKNYLKPSLDIKTIDYIGSKLDKIMSDLKQNDNSKFSNHLELYQVVKKQIINIRKIKYDIDDNINTIKDINLFFISLNKIINIKKQINKVLIDEKNNIDEEQKNNLHNLLEVINQKQKYIEDINAEITNIENKDEYLNKLYFFEINEELNEQEIDKLIQKYKNFYYQKIDKQKINDSNIEILNNLIDNINEIQFHKLNDIHKQHIKYLKEQIKIKLDWNNLASYINILYYFEINIQYPLIIKKYDNFKNIDEKEVLNRLDELYNLIDETYKFIANYERILSDEIVNNLKTIKNIHDVKTKIANDFEIKIEQIDIMVNFVDSFKSSNEKISYIETYIQNYNDLKTSIQNKIIELNTNYQNKFHINHIITNLEILTTEINRKIYNLDLDIQRIHLYGRR